MRDLPDVPALRTLDAPPGGLAMLRERLDIASRRRWWLAAIPAAGAVALVLWLVLRPVRDVTAPIAPTALADPDVGQTFYWVASTPGPRPRPQRAVVPVVSAPIAIDEAPQVSSVTAAPAE